MNDSAGATDQVGPVPVPLKVSADPTLGGRWTSLRTDPGGRGDGGRGDGARGREWLWRGVVDGRDQVLPNDAFVDAGGLEECVPTIRGIPDHGDVWSRPWRVSGPDTATVNCADFSLARRLTDRHGIVVADYRLTASPGYQFVWAAHALLDLSTAATVDAPAGTPTRLYPEAATVVTDGRWPVGAPWRTESWPQPAGIPLHRLGPDDGTAVGAILVGCTVVNVIDGTDRLTMRLRAPGQPVSVALWRNLRGWPEGAPYRSIGVEPMLGAVFDLAEAPMADAPMADAPMADAPMAGGSAAGGSAAGGSAAGGSAVGAGNSGGSGCGNAAVVPASGEVRWRLTITAARLADPADSGVPHSL